MKTVLSLSTVSISRAGPRSWRPERRMKTILPGRSIFAPDISSALCSRRGPLRRQAVLSSRPRMPLPDPDLGQSFASPN